MSKDTDLIAKRRKAIAALRASIATDREKLDAKEARLASEEEELAIAERVMGRLSRYSGVEIDADDEVGAEVEAKKEGVSIPKNGTPRPDGIPTVREMLDKVLEDAERRGMDGLQGRDLIIGVNDRWWPGVGWNAILPTAIRLVKKGYLAKSGNLFIRATKMTRQPKLRAVS